MLFRVFCGPPVLLISIQHQLALDARSAESMAQSDALRALRFATLFHQHELALCGVFGD